jgi:phage gp36-like protein
MSYCTEDDLISRFGEDELIDATGRGQSTEIEGEPLEDAIADSDAVIERHLRGRYTLPIDGSNDLRQIACDLTRYFLWGISAPEHVRQRYEDAMSALRDIAKGVTLLDADPADGETKGPLTAAVRSKEQVFTQETLDKVSLV